MKKIPGMEAMLFAMINFVFELMMMRIVAYDLLP